MFRLKLGFILSQVIKLSSIKQIAHSKGTTFETVIAYPAKGFFACCSQHLVIRNII